MASTEHDVEPAELRWAGVTLGFSAIIFVLTLFAALALQRNPPSNLERLDPKSLHLTGEFTEPNLGTRVEANGRVTVRMVATQFAFVPHCVVVPEGREVALRLSSADVIHGILVTGTNVNTMVVPGFVAEVRTRFDKPGEHPMPCHEYCSVGHEGMWARVKVVDPGEFNRVYGKQSRASCERQ